MDELWAALQASPVAAWARSARWGYAALNGAHIVGIALLVGAMVPLNLVRIGAALGVGRIPAETAARLLVPFAGAGLVLAVGTGAVMFAARAGEYAALGVVQAKLALVGAGTLIALALHARHGRDMQRAGPRRTAAHAALSLVMWLTVLGLGRLIAFVG
ncbi:DUF2214 domain-containing protein [Acuticoccus sp. I52.16.1]|uniref:DUF2214 domain-containing protein n=1 Tax=Acuticoccus sp. I52.16.1 TaxID=2928472 RepID=UPI001FD48102|nr:DUF2214 domain-containing protein [Acuticoccus sp. I52.16.1]UOM34765.1 DUF2214 domain-containing protein [Acuticoccus sp. I52.16.1]